MNANSYSQSAVTNTTANNSAGATSVTVAAAANIAVGDLIVFANHATEYEVTGISTNTLTIREKGKTTGLTSAVDGSGTAVDVTVKWFYHAEFDSAPELLHKQLQEAVQVMKFTLLLSMKMAISVVQQTQCLRSFQIFQ